ncbi:MAG: cupin domain-containing protein [Spirochaetia bacterium]|jgi:mannose-6-phosphate isomerase-like protein (cupin superfamily)|nr:cupin domain-containing protein [Spirochaetia bacterium]
MGTMTKKAGDLRTNLEPNLKGGRDTVRIINILESGEMFGTGRLFGISVIPPGGSIGRHTHEGDFETYYILKGSARVNDNGAVHDLGPGDMTQCKDGDSHSIENTGAEDLEYLAVILYSKDRVPS